MRRRGEELPAGGGGRRTGHATVEPRLGVRLILLIPVALERTAPHGDYLRKRGRGGEREAHEARKAGAGWSAAPERGGAMRIASGIVEVVIHM